MWVFFYLWMTSEIKKALLEKAKIYRRFVKHGRRDDDRKNLRDIEYKTSALIKSTKTSYLSSLRNKLNDPNIGPKKYWSILNKFTNERNAPIIPPIRQGDTFVTNVAEKASLFILTPFLSRLGKQESA